MSVTFHYLRDMWHTQLNFFYFDYYTECELSSINPSTFTGYSYGQQNANNLEVNEEGLSLPEKFFEKSKMKNGTS